MFDTQITQDFKTAILEVDQLALKIGKSIPPPDIVNSGQEDYHNKLTFKASLGDTQTYRM